jgi:fido (protein-threonine AMPylation protein)
VILRKIGITMTFRQTHELLASSLTELKAATERVGSSVLLSRELSRIHRERLIAAGYLEPIIRGWMVVSRPAGIPRIMSAWSSVYWEFAKRYLNDRFGGAWWLDATGSLRLQTENWHVPDQLVVCVPGKINQSISLPGKTSFYIYGDETAPETVLKDGIRIIPLEMAIAKLPISAWRQNTTDALTAISSVRGHSGILRATLQGGMITRAGVAAGAMRTIGREFDADQIIKSIGSLNHRITETNPFKGFEIPKFEASKSQRSPAKQRITVMWARLRTDVLAAFQTEPSHRPAEATVVDIANRYIDDAWNSLKIEGYSASRELIADTMRADWKPDAYGAADRNVKAAMGYRNAFLAALEAVRQLSEGRSASDLIEGQHQRWHALLFGNPPSFSYRNRPVFLGGSRHVPYSVGAVADGMAGLFECMENETDARVRAVLAPFLFTYVHPYLDGNGRLARMMMNVLLVEGGYRWTVVPFDERGYYMKSLEAASTGGDIRPLADLISFLVEQPTSYAK